MLIRAQLAATPAQRYRLYESAIEQFPRDGFVDFLYGDELYHRGPLTGIPGDSALPLLLAAVAKTPSLAPAWEHLVRMLIERGRADSARWALDGLRRVSAPPDESGMDLVRLWEVAFRWRFGDAADPGVPDDVLADPVFLVQFRLANGVGLPEQQAAVGALVADDLRAPPSVRAIGATGRAVALFRLGRIAGALAAFDSAAAWFGSPEARLHAAAWRVIPAALGVPGIPDAEQQRGREQLERLARESAYGVRAAWALALAAYSEADSSDAHRWAAVVARHDHPLAVQLDALEEAAAGRPDLALEVSAPALAYDSGGTGGDPFARAVLHLRRAAWYEELGRWRDADRERLWYENADVTAQFDGVPLSSEVDWALRPYAALLRARSALDRDDPRAACRLARPVSDAWASGDSAFQNRVRTLRERLPRWCAA